MEEDIRLVRLTLQGSHLAFRQLVERYQHYVFTIAFRILKSREEAEEAAQDVFVKVHKMLGTFEQKSKFSTWLYTIAYRTAIDLSRRKNPGAHSLDDGESFLQLEDTANISPVAMMQHQDLHDALQAAINKLRPDDAAIITLFYLNEKPIKEIAEITGLTETNIKTRLFRLREALRQHLSPFWESVGGGGQDN